MAKPGREAKKQRTQQAKAARLAAQRRQRRVKVISVASVLILVFVGLGAFLNTGNSNDSSSSTTTTTTVAPEAIPVVPAGQSITGDTPCPPADGSAPRASSFEKAPSMCINPAKTYTADFDTTEGHVVIALDAAKMPNAVNNFVVLSRYKYYDGSGIVRTNTGIDIIQGGAPSTQTNADPGPGYTIPDEGGPFTYKDGDLVMARTSQPNSTGAQWFFGAGPNVSNLDGQGPYLKIGSATSGIDVLHKILALHQDTSGDQAGEGKPSKNVIVNKVTITES